MAAQLRYFAQPFWRACCGATEIYEFVCAVDAEEGAMVLIKGGADGAVAWIQAFSDTSEEPTEPELLISIGDVPPMTIDPEGPEPWVDDMTYFKIEYSEAGDVWTQIDPCERDEVDDVAA